ncbi:MAG: Na+/H+ antiporter NhaC [Opitutales bacterium]|nr:Na+/H+ antiporter NhaC [Opitutales bacterium]
MSFRTPTLLESLIPLFAIALFLGVGYGVLGIRAEILLLAATAVASALAWRMGYRYKDLEEGIIASMMKGMPAMLIVIVVGALIGSWIASGTIPMLIYYGLEIISPKYFLVTACLVSAVVSLVTGTSYGTVGTIGVAFVGIAEGLGIPLGQAAGAIVAGAYFGDKLSPFSDTTNLAPIAVQGNLYDHIRHTLWTTTPAMLLGLIVYFYLGLTRHSDGSSIVPAAIEMQETIVANFTFHPLLILPPVITLTLAIMRKPVIPGMLLASLVASILAMVYQGAVFKEAMNVMVIGYHGITGSEMVDLLLQRGGMLSMMNVKLIAFCAFAFGGVIQHTGMLAVILQALTRFANTTGRLVLTAVTASITTAVMTGSSFLSILIPGELFAPAFKKHKLAAKNLSRTTEDSGTVIVPLVPWSIAGVFMAATLNVPVISYAPWAILCYTGFIFAIIYGYTGIGIAPKIRDDETQPGS